MIRLHLCATCHQSITFQATYEHRARGHQVESLSLLRRDRRGNRGPEFQWSSDWAPVEPEDDPEG